MDKKPKQGIAHLLGIFALPIILIVGFYVKWMLARILLLGLFIYVARYLWKQVLND